MTMTRETLIAVAATLWSPEDTSPEADEYRQGMIDLIAHVSHEEDEDIDTERDDIGAEIGARA